MSNHLLRYDHTKRPLEYFGSGPLGSRKSCPVCCHADDHNELFVVKRSVSLSFLLGNWTVNELQGGKRRRNNRDDDYDDDYQCEEDGKKKNHLSHSRPSTTCSRKSILEWQLSIYIWSCLHSLQSLFQQPKQKCASFGSPVLLCFIQVFCFIKFVSSLMSKRAPP